MYYIQRMLVKRHTIHIAQETKKKLVIIRLLTDESLINIIHNLRTYKNRTKNQPAIHGQRNENEQSQKENKRIFSSFVNNFGLQRN